MRLHIVHASEKGGDRWRAIAAPQFDIGLDDAFDYIIMLKGQWSSQTNIGSPRSSGAATSIYPHSGRRA